MVLFKLENCEFVNLKCGYNVVVVMVIIGVLR